MRFFLLLLALLCLLGGESHAADPGEIEGIPAVLPSGNIMVGGHKVTLWGIDALANDQKCWHDDRAWNCGEQALISLKHYVNGFDVRCYIKSDEDSAVPAAQCFRMTGDKPEDIAGYMVDHGWARDKNDMSDSLYADDEDEALQSRRGIWTSRFQTAEDWKNGIPNYVQYKEAQPDIRTTSAQ